MPERQRRIQLVAYTFIKLHDGLSVRKLFDAKTPMLAAIAGIFDPAKGHIGLGYIIVVNKDHTRIKVVPRQIEGFVLVFGENAPAESKSTVISYSHGVFIVFGPDKGGDRPK